MEEDEQRREIGRAFLFVMYNDSHPDRPFGLLEDVFVSEEHRGRGLAKSLVGKVIELAKTLGCHKLIATSRNTRLKVHGLYRELGFTECEPGFTEWGKEFRMNFE